MAKLNLKFLIITALLFSSVGTANADASLVQPLQTTVPTVIDVTAINIGLAVGAINPQTGISTSPAASFQLKTNATDNTYDYIITATLRTIGDVHVNAYTQVGAQPYILLGNNGSLYYPSIAAVNDIKSGSPTAANNGNVIAYPISNTLTNLQSATLTDIAAYGGLCYVVKTGASQNGIIVQTIGAAPLANTYSFLNDLQSGYQTIIVFTANPKP